jgi:uncharacterized protein YjiS (DUF1127 family)
MSFVLSISVQSMLAKARGEALRGLRACLGWADAYFDRRAAMAALGRLDDHALHDIGIVRSQIEAAARGFITPSNPGRPR